MFVYAPCGDGKLYKEGCYTRTQVSADHVVILDGACPREKNKFFFNLLLFGENEQNIGRSLGVFRAQFVLVISLGQVTTESPN